MSITPIEAALLAQLLRTRVALLTELLAAQIQALPPGDDSWADLEDQLQIATNTLHKVEAIR